MQLGARYRSVFELMEQVFQDKQPADNIINIYFRERRFIGSGDRRFISEKIWEIIRNRSRLEFEVGSLDARKMLILWLKDDDLSLVFNDEKYSLPALGEAEKNWLKTISDRVYPDYVEAECPKWLFEKIADIDLLKSLNNPATADFRINGSSREEVIKTLGKEGFEFVATPYSPIGIRALNRVNLNNCISYQEGLIEVQDEASQLVAILADVDQNDKTIDYCCGAGGKSLTISYLLGGKGEIFAHDIDATRLDALKPRIQRLGAKNIKTITSSELENNYTRFIIDAPCSGSGTWRRSPDAKYRLSSKMLDKICKVQAEILENAYDRVAKGGRIIYITCSILPQENLQIIEGFKQNHPDVLSVSLREIWQQKIKLPYIGSNDFYLQFSPLHSQTDGFFIAVLQK